MTEIGIIASVVQIADIGLRLSIKLYTFGEIVASANRSVISISKDVSLTSGVLKELGQLLDKDKETGTFSETAVRTADGVVKECLEVFKEMDNIIVKKLPSLGAAGKGGGQGERVKRATVMLERLKWGYLQPKLELLRSNLDSLKSTLLLMLNVITYARQVSEKAELPSVIAEQKCLIEELVHSNQEYILKFERLKLGIEGPVGGPVDDASRGGVVEIEPSKITKSLSGTLARKFKRMKSVIAGTSLQDIESARGLRSKDFKTATWSSPKAQSSTTGPLATPPNANANNIFIDTSVRGSLARPLVQERGIPTAEAPVGFDQEVLFKQLEHHSMLIKNLLKEVDEAQYEITFQSRLRMKGGIAGLHEGERRDLEKMWGLTALQSAEQRLDSLMEGIGELPRVNALAVPVASAEASPYTAHMLGTPRPFSKAPVAEAPQHDPIYKDRYESARHRLPSIDYSSTYAGDTTHRTDLLSDNSSYISVHPDGLESISRHASMSISKPLPATVNETPSDTPTVTRARRAPGALLSGPESMERADIAQAKAEEQRESSAIGKRKHTGDRIGGYIEPHQEEDDTGEGGANMTTPSSRPYLSQSERSTNTWRQGTDSAASNRRVLQHQGLERARLDSPEGSDVRTPTSHIHVRSNQKMASVPYFRGYLPAQSVPALQARLGGQIDPLEAYSEMRRYSPVQRLLTPQAPAKFQPQIEQGDSQLANVDLVNRLISLWTTVKP